jgi:hypothetical protein
MSTTEYLLHKMPKDKLAATLEPYYNDLYSQLSESQKKDISFELVVDAAHYRLRSLQYARPLRFDVRPLSKAGDSACITAIARVVADAIGIVFGLAGLSDSVCRAVAGDLMDDLGEAGARSLVDIIGQIKDASSTLDKAKGIWSLVKGIYNIVGAKAIWKAIKDSMSWYDWALTGTVAVAQLTIWFASDGLALVGEIVLEATAIAYTVEDAVQVANCC